MRNWIMYSIGAVAVIVIICLYIWPIDGSAVRAAKKKVSALNDKRQALDVLIRGYERPVDCWDAVQNPYNPDTGQPVVWTDYDSKTKTYDCFKSPGFSRRTGQGLVEITVDEVDKIRTDPQYRPAPPAPQPSPTPTPDPAPAPTPLPDISDCCSK